MRGPGPDMSARLRAPFEIGSRTFFRGTMTERTQFYYRDPATPEPMGSRRLGGMALIERDGSLLLERRADAPL